MPLKQEVFAYGQAQDYWSQRLGVANTAIFDWSVERATQSLHLYNTDVEGIVCAISEGLTEGSQYGNPSRMHDSFKPVSLIEAASLGGRDKNDTDYMGVSDASAVVIGTGSTACSALAALSVLGVRRVTIVAHHLEHAKQAVQLAQQLSFARVELTDMENCLSALMQARIVVSAIPSGGADALAQRLESSGLRQTSSNCEQPVLLDVAYNRQASKLTQAWHNGRGGIAVGGERMLLYQAVRQLSLMTGLAIEQVPIGAMDTAMQGEIS
ncbi:hypothetical protein KIMH_08210 [Bombiscardovia apis]|uniref:Quinate/shikimate 5-dehydrogenase/glutamyl-tRNA reductase domain-containing protein n=2 Tax=Bombiscardovia apis TaxID=2932182 RepID=A0ABN6SJ31_9BIFI|nr:hypothetical protein KIMH_08210 [Bombiscardovia apis]